MNTFGKFNFKNINELESKIKELGFDLKAQKDLSILNKPVNIGIFELNNPFVVHPMEGCDSHFDGSPSKLTFRRYKRFANGGAGLIWFEATSITEEGRGNPRQLFLNGNTANSFKDLLDTVIFESKINSDNKNKIINILQLSHAGRYSNPKGFAKPFVISDIELDSLKTKFIEASVLAKEVGFNGVDIKACHGYLLSELLSAYNRSGRYGGSFENRTRFLIDTVREIRKNTGENFIVAVRLNAYDGIPGGWGVDKKDPQKIDLYEPQKLAKLLHENGVSLLSVTAGIPIYANPQITRPFDYPLEGMNFPEEHPLFNVERLFSLAEKIQRSVPEVVVVGAGYSWFREFFPYYAAYNIGSGAAKLVGVGRGALAYPDFVKDLLKNGELKSDKVCISCSRCSQIMKNKGKAGCVVRDPSYYLSEYLQCRKLGE